MSAYLVYKLSESRSDEVHIMVVYFVLVLLTDVELEFIQVPLAFLLPFDEAHFEVDQGVPILQREFKR